MIYFLFIAVSAYIWIYITAIQNYVNRKKLLNMLKENPLGFPEVLKFEDKKEIWYIWEYLEYHIICSLKMNKSNDLSEISRVAYFATKSNKFCLIDLTITRDDSQRSEILKAVLLSCIVVFTNEQLKKGIRHITNHRNVLNLQEWMELEKMNNKGIDDNG